MVCDEVKLLYVYQQVLTLCQNAHGPLDHADLRVWRRVGSEPNRDIIRDYLEILEHRNKVTIVRKIEEEGGWILTLIRPFLLTRYLVYGKLDLSFKILLEDLNEKCN